MFERMLRKIREKILTRQYVMTLHAEEEMDADGLTIHDVERVILTGKVLGRQRDILTGGWKYRIYGKTFDGDEAECIVKIGATGKAVIITVYLASRTG